MRWPWVSRAAYELLREQMQAQGERYEQRLAEARSLLDAERARHESLLGETLALKREHFEKPAPDPDPPPPPEPLPEVVQRVLARFGDHPLRRRLEPRARELLAAGIGAEQVAARLWQGQEIPA
jgi:hypothetical protein